MQNLKYSRKFNTIECHRIKGCRFNLLKDENLTLLGTMPKETHAMKLKKCGFNPLADEKPNLLGTMPKETNIFEMAHLLDFMTRQMLFVN